MMTTERMSELITDVTLGATPKAADDEEKRFIDSVKVDIEAAKKDGMTIVTPQD